MNKNTVGRRELLRLGGVAAAGAALPLLGSELQGSPARAATASLADPDHLCRVRRFEFCWGRFLCARDLGR